MSRRAPGLREFFEERLLSGLDLLHLVSETVLDVVSTEFHIRPGGSVFQAGLRQLSRRGLLTNTALQSCISIFDFPFLNNGFPISENIYLFFEKQIRNLILS